MGHTVISDTKKGPDYWQGKGQKPAPAIIPPDPTPVPLEASVCEEEATEGPSEPMVDARAAARAAHNLIAHLLR